MIRPLPLLGALGLLAIVWTGAMDALGLGPFTAHMLRHMTVVALAAPLLVLALLPLASFAVPPLMATLLEFVIVWGWHLPAMHDAAWLTPSIFAAEQLSFLLAGTLLWTSALDPERPLAGAGALLLTTMHMTLLGALLTLSPKVLYSFCGGEADQQIGGMIMLAIGAPVYLIVGLILVGKTLGRSSDLGERTA